MKFKTFLLKESIQPGIPDEMEPVHSKYQKFITPEMEEHYIKRTMSHIEKVQDNGLRLIELLPFGENEKYEFLAIIREHDASKFKEPERSLYVLISWRYHIEEDKFKEINLPEWLLTEMTKITEYHTKNNKHHPEYWDTSLISGFINPENRDETEVMVDGTQMPKLHIMEMVCDWCSVSEERGGDPTDWADMNVNKRWKFTKEQVELIYGTIKILKMNKGLGEDTVQKAIRYGYVVETDSHLFHFSTGIRSSQSHPSSATVERRDGEWIIKDAQGHDITSGLIEVEEK